MNGHLRRCRCASAPHVLTAYAPVRVLAGERERLVPLVRERLVAVDLEAGRVTLDWHPDD